MKALGGAARQQHRQQQPRQKGGKENDIPPDGWAPHGPHNVWYDDSMIYEHKMYHVS